MRIVMTAVLLLTFSHSAVAQKKLLSGEKPVIYSAGELASDCQKWLTIFPDGKPLDPNATYNIHADDMAQALRCIGYVQGALDQFMEDGRGKHYTPVAATIDWTGTLIANFVKYVSDHPEERNLAATTILDKTAINRAKSPNAQSLLNQPREGAAPRSGPGAALSGATTFRGHRLGETWNAFSRTDGGLCEISQINKLNCGLVANGKDGVLTVHDGDSKAIVEFCFERGRFESAETTMEGPEFAPLTYLQATYGTPAAERSNPSKGEALSDWRFSDGGEVLAEEKPTAPGKFTITVFVSAKEWVAEHSASN